MKWIVLLLTLCHSLVFSQVNSSITHDNLTRTFVYYTPSSWTPASQMPLLILLHGLTQTGSGVMDITQFNLLAEQNNFIVVYPDGINYAWNANMNVTVSTADDLGFIEQLALHFQTNFNSDPARQYLVGFSNGGFMSHKIACESSMCFAAIATVSGNMSDTTYSQCAPQFSPAVLHIHGTADAIVPYNGGATTGVSVAQTMEKWRTFLSCDPTPSIITMPNPNLLDLSSPELQRYQNCASNLEHVKISGGGHQWPGIQTLVGGAGTINFDFYSPEYIWNFLNGKSCPTNALQETALTFSVSPNPMNELLIVHSDRTVPFDMFDLTGKLQRNGRSNEPLFVGDLATGMYILKLYDGYRVFSTKILKTACN